MRMIDLARRLSVKNLSMFLTVEEAQQMCTDLSNLLVDPEASEHFHIQSHDYAREISCSLITDAKLKNIDRYNKLEQKVLSEK